MWCVVVQITTREEHGVSQKNPMIPTDILGLLRTIHLAQLIMMHCMCRYVSAFNQRFNIHGQVMCTVVVSYHLKPRILISTKTAIK